MTPSSLMTIIDGKVVAQTTVGWDPRLMGPASASWSLGTNNIGGAAPTNGGTDGLGSATGTWGLSGPGESMKVVATLDPLGGLQSATANGVGVKVAYSSGPMGGSLQTSVSAVSANAEMPAADQVEMSGTSDAVCE
jgi:hypothetical protein